MLFGWKGYICLDETTVVSKITSVLEETGYEYDMSVEGKTTLKTVFEVKKPEKFKIEVNTVAIPFIPSYTSWLQISNVNKGVLKTFMKRFLEELPRKPWVYEKKETIEFYRYLDKFVKYYLLPIVLGDILFFYLGYVDMAGIIGIVLGLIFGFYLVSNSIPLMAKIQWRKWVK